MEGGAGVEGAENRETGDAGGYYRYKCRGRRRSGAAGQWRLGGGRVSQVPEGMTEVRERERGGGAGGREEGMGGASK